MTTVIGVILYASLMLLLLAAAITLFRLFKGPTVLDRAVSLDVIAACVIGIVIILIVWRGRTDLTALMIIFALTAFFSSVTVARFGVAPTIQRRRQVMKLEQKTEEVGVEVVEATGGDGPAIQKKDDATPEPKKSGEGS